MRIIAVAFLLVFCAGTAEAKLEIARRGQARCVILRQPQAVPSERYAADELAYTLKQITGAAFEVRESSVVPNGPAIVIGPGPIATSLFPEAGIDRFGPEQITIRTKGDRLLLAGGRPRGTLYAVYRFLQDQLGVRWWTPWASRIPKAPSLSIGDLSVTTSPAFESRDPFWYLAFDGDWAARNFSNSQSARLNENHGGKILYKGFVHTFYPLVPPEQHFRTHPEWYSLINGKRTTDGAQLCTTNPELRRFLVERVKQWLRETPDARIISVSQNDWHGACQCANCKAIDDREGSYSGTMLDLANYVGEQIESEFPGIAVDTLAYQYTRKAPKSLKPRPNVIVRLCSIECDFRAPLEEPSNRSFGDDLRAWGKISNRLYIWDYTTNFAHYPLPHPNWFSLGANVRFFHQNGVKGLFEQGAYQSHSGEMAELRAWVLARLLWNPNQDDRKLIDEFLDGYYGSAAAKPIRQYMNLLHEKSRGFYLTCYNSPSAPFLDFATLSKAEKLWRAAERAASGKPDLLWRVRQSHLPIRYAFLQRWPQLRREALDSDSAWPLPVSRRAVADEWLAVATGTGPAGWSPMTHVNESGTTPKAFVARYELDPPDRGKYPPPPEDLPGIDPKSGIEGQESLARIHLESRWAEVRADSAASDGMAVRMPGTHREWAFQLSLAELGKRALAEAWNVYAVIRVEKSPSADSGSIAFTAGVYDTAAKSGPSIGPKVSEIKGESYRSYLLGRIDSGKNRYVWAAPTANPGVVAVWIDRIYLVPAR